MDSHSSRGSRGDKAKLTCQAVLGSQSHTISPYVCLVSARHPSNNFVLVFLTTAEVLIADEQEKI